MPNADEALQSGNDLPPLSSVTAGIGDRIVATRMALGYRTARQFARAMGISEGRLSQWEHDKHAPPIENIIRMKQMHPGVTLDWIYTGDPNGLNWMVVQTLVSLGAQQDAPVSARRLRLTLGRAAGPAPMNLHEGQEPLEEPGGDRPPKRFKPI